MTDFPLLGRRRIARSSFLTFDREYRWTPGGDVVRREVVRHPGSVVVIPWDGERVHALRQYRAPVDTAVLELPAGKLDVAGEAPELTAVRECIEEIGMRPERVTLLQRCWISPGFTDEFTWIYLAEGLTEVSADPQGAEELHAEQIGLTVGEVRDLVDAGEVRDATTLIGLMALLRHVER
ncbi:MAG TPA: NUDIX hydrolase [Acidimicrobiia bacterium]|nr:NUDIX hydrolase [Acidimicrobiia bacterium]